jgi:hypothetical protein
MRIPCPGEKQNPVKIPVPEHSQNIQGDSPLTYSFPVHRSSIISSNAIAVATVGIACALGGGIGIRDSSSQSASMIAVSASAQLQPSVSLLCTLWSRSVDGVVVVEIVGFTHVGTRRVWALFSARDAIAGKLGGRIGDNNEKTEERLEPKWYQSGTQNRSSAGNA